jgi:phage/plasmid-associated DNA primase
VDEPKEPGEFKIDRSLPSRMREDLTWRQTFMQILLSYYYKDVKEPPEVKLKTNEYRSENNLFYNWLEENIKYEEESILKLTDVCEAFMGKKVAPRSTTKFRKELEKYIKEKYKNVEYEYRNSTYKNATFRGWLGLSLK